MVWLDKKTSNKYGEIDFQMYFLHVALRDLKNIYIVSKFRSQHRSAELGCQQIFFWKL